MSHAEEIQRTYYAATAARYDDSHLANDHEHTLALEYIAVMAQSLGLTSMLDVGFGTGRGILYLSQKQPGMLVYGVEPVWALIEQGRRANALPSSTLTQASGYRLPFADSSFDAVCALGVMHHVETPSVVVDEMLRVTRRAVFISDANRFGFGSTPARLAKLLAWKCGVWRALDLIKTGGKGYRLSEGDGLSYSYSVFDSLDRLSEWAERVMCIPTKHAPTSRHLTWYHPLLTASHVLVCGVRG